MSEDNKKSNDVQVYIKNMLYRMDDELAQKIKKYLENKDKKALQEMLMEKIEKMKKNLNDKEKEAIDILINMYLDKDK